MLILKKTLSLLNSESIAILFSKNSYLRKTGWIKSLNFGKPIDEFQNPIPWMTYPLIDFLKTRLNKNFLVFEFGGGNSTIWFAKYVKHIRSVENDQYWVNHLQENLPSNSELIFRDTNNLLYNDIVYNKIGNLTNYSKAITESNQKYEIVIIDGVDRNNCIVNSLNNITDNGIFIIDNYEFINEMKDAIDVLFREGFKVLEFWGMSPMIYNKSCTTVFYRENNCLGI